MIEYTIRVAAIDVKRGLVSVILLPQGDTEAEPLSKTVHVNQSRLSEINAMTDEGKLIALREEIMRGNAMYQDEWQEQIANSSFSMTPVLEAAVGREFHAVTEAEIQELEQRQLNVQTSSAEEI